MTQIGRWPGVSRFWVGRTSSRRNLAKACQLGVEPLETRTVLSASGLSALFDAPHPAPAPGPNYLSPALHFAASDGRHAGPSRDAGPHQGPLTGRTFDQDSLDSRAHLLSPNVRSSAPTHRAYFAAPILASFIGTRSLGGVNFDRNDLTLPAPPSSPNGSFVLAPVAPNDSNDSTSLTSGLDVRAPQLSQPSSSSSASIDSDLLRDQLASTAHRDGASLGSLESVGLATDASRAASKAFADVSLSYFQSSSVRDTSSSPRETFQAQARLSAASLQSTSDHDDVVPSQPTPSVDDSSRAAPESDSENRGGLIELESDLATWRDADHSANADTAENSEADFRVATSKRLTAHGGHVIHQSRRFRVEHDHDDEAASNADLAVRNVSAWQAALESVQQPQEEGGMIELLAADVSRFGLGNSEDQALTAYVARNVDLEAGVQLYQAFELFAASDGQFAGQPVIETPVAANDTAMSDAADQSTDDSSGNPLSQAVLPTFLALGALVWSRSTRTKKSTPASDPNELDR